jgi:group I intron endonuclease
MWSVYIHTSPSGKKYIGITSKNPEKRWGYMGNNYRRNGHHHYFVSAIDKYGWDSFKHEIILSDLSESEAKYTERYLIRWYKSYNICYNQTDGGDGTCGFSKIPWNKGVHCSPETKQKISNANKGKTSYWKGKHLSEETRRKIAKTRIDKGIKSNPIWSQRRVKVYKDGVLVSEHASVKEAAISIGAVYQYASKCLVHNKLCKKYELKYA